MMSIQIRIVFAAVLWAAHVVPALAEQSACAGEYVDNQRPALHGREICRLQFALIYDDVHHVPVLSAEHLTRAEVIAASHVRRDHGFHKAAGVSPRDYTRSGYDRGHMTPSGDMPDQASQRESFGMDNVTPQRPGLNEKGWVKLEEKVRALANAAGEVYVLTGELAGSTTIGPGIVVPRALYKGVYVPARHVCWVGVADNQNGARVRTLSTAQFRAKYRIDLFPSGVCDAH